MLATANNAVGIDAQTEATPDTDINVGMKPKFETLDLLDFDGSIKKLVCQKVDDDIYAVFVRVRGAVAYGLEPSDFARSQVVSPALTEGVCAQ